MVHSTEIKKPSPAYSEIYSKTLQFIKTISTGSNKQVFKFLIYVYIIDSFLIL